jgi:hypothetical protein
MKAGCVARSGRRLLLAALVGALVSWVSGCAGSGVARERTGGGRPMDCILGGGIRDYSVLDERNLLFDGPGRTAYHVVLIRPATNIDREFQIGVYDNDGRICPYGGDAIIIDGPIRDVIPILSIERIDQQGVEALQVEFGIIEMAGDAVTVTEIK